DISFNEISRLPKNTRIFDSIEYLSIRGNQIDSLNLDFLELRKLYEIDISNNPIKHYGTVFESPSMHTIYMDMLLLDNRSSRVFLGGFKKISMRRMKNVIKEKYISLLNNP